MRVPIVPLLLLPLVFALPRGFATEIDVVVGESASHVAGGNEGAVRTRARLSASANLYRSDARPPIVTTRAWIWSLPDGVEPSEILRPVPVAGWPSAEVFAWDDDNRRIDLLDSPGARVLELPPIETVPGMTSRWSGSPGDEWRVAVEPEVLVDTVVLQPHIQWTEAGGESPATVVRSLPTLHLAGAESRLVRIEVAGEGQGTTRLLELRSHFGWDGTPPKVRQRTYTDSWTDRLSVGGQLDMRGVYVSDDFSQTDSP